MNKEEQEFTINIPVKIKLRKANCDFCCQCNVECFKGTNDEIRDICKTCVRELSKKL